MDDKNIVQETEQKPLSRRELRRAREQAKRRCIPFLTALALVTVIAWLLPLRPTVSEAEKRELAKFPKFSFETLFSGDYFSDIDDWFSDTFTFREGWMKVSTTFKNSYGIQDITVIGDTAVSDAIPVISTPQPSTAPVESENVVVEPTAESTPEATQAPTWDEDELTEDDFTASYSVLDVGDSVYNITVFVQFYADQYISYMNTLAEQLDGRATLYDMVVPENTTFMLRRETREKYGCVPEEDVLDYLYGCMDERIHTLNVIENLQSHNSEYIVFHADHHWTALGAYYAYEVFCEDAGLTSVPLSEFKVNCWEGFLGTLYYKSTHQNRIAQDDVYTYEPQGDIHLYLNFNDDDGLGEEQESILIDRSTSEPGGLYSTFLGSDSAKATLVNNDIQDGSACLVAKTSVGDPFVYYLANHYQYVHIIDVRNYYRHTISDLVDLYDIDDVIFCHGTGLAQAKGVYCLDNLI